MDVDDASDEEKLATLRRLATEAFASVDRGEGIDLDSAEALERFIEDLGRRASEQVLSTDRPENSSDAPR